MISSISLLAFAAMAHRPDETKQQAIHMRYLVLLANVVIIASAFVTLKEELCLLSVVLLRRAGNEQT